MIILAGVRVESEYLSIWRDGWKKQPMGVVYPAPSPLGPLSALMPGRGKMAVSSHGTGLAG